MNYYWWGALIWCAWCVSDFQRDKEKYSIGVITAYYILAGLIWPFDFLVCTFEFARKTIRKHHDTP